ncbi:DUF2249 domain-containing protein [Brachybacterium sp. AOP29-B2-41]|uniref:DUF2249 domain-containing protein n=1 Tax=Brachybacterium sp. AOP29-B2-41 TaxID=3457704 RepID=UPI00403446EE
MLRDLGPYSPQDQVENVEWIRASIFGAIESLVQNGGMIISATHDPVPLLMQLQAKHGDTYATEYLDKGPERWRILIRRAA